MGKNGRNSMEETAVKTMLAFTIPFLPANPDIYVKVECVSNGICKASGQIASVALV